LAGKILEIRRNINQVFLDVVRGTRCNAGQRDVDRKNAIYAARQKVIIDDKI